MGAVTDPLSNLNPDSEEAAVARWQRFEQTRPGPIVAVRQVVAYQACLYDSDYDRINESPYDLCSHLHPTPEEALDCAREVKAT